MENKEIVIDPIVGVGCSMPLFVAWVGATYYGAKRLGIIGKVSYGLTGSIALWFAIVSVISSINTRPLPKFMIFVVTPPIAVIITVYVIGKFIPNRMSKQKRKNSE